MTIKLRQPQTSPDTSVASCQSKGEACRHRILNAARQLFYKKGFFATSINDVAEEAGVHKGNLSYYFPSKSELLESATATREAEIRAELAELDAMSGSLYEVLDAVVKRLESRAEETANYGCEIGTLTNELGKGDGELQHPARQLFELLQTWLTERFAREFPRAQAKEHAEYFLTLAQGSAVMAHAYRDPKVMLRQCKRLRQWLAETCQKA